MVFFLYLFLIRRVKVHRQDFNICCTGACALGTFLHWLSESCRFRSGLFTHCRRISAGFEQEVPQTHHQTPGLYLPDNPSVSLNRQMLRDYPCPNITLLPRVVINMLAFVYHLSSSCCLTAHQNQPHEILLKTQALVLNTSSSCRKQKRYVQHYSTCERSLPPVECFKSAASARKSYQVKQLWSLDGV